MEKEKEFIPKACEECIKSKYKLPKPDCAYEQGLEHKRTYEYFKNTYGVTLPQHLEALSILKERKAQCLEKIKDQVTRMVSLRRGLGIDNILGLVNDLNSRMDQMENNGDKSYYDDRDRILASPKVHSTEEQTTKKFVKEQKEPEKTKEPEFINKPEKNKPKKKKASDTLDMKERGWLMYIRNCKKEKVDYYVGKLRKEHPDLSDKQIKISTNAAGNYMIRYTLNPDMA